MNKYDKQTEDLILEKYFSGAKCLELEKEYSLTSHYISDLLKRRGLKTRAESVDEQAIIDEYLNHVRLDRIYRKYHIGASRLYRILDKNGIEKRLTEIQLQIKELREKGLCSSEIRDITGLDTKQISHVAKVIGMPFTEEEKARSKKLGWRKGTLTQHGTLDERFFHNKEKVKKIHPNWELISGDIQADGIKCELRCQKCGEIIAWMSSTVRQSKSIMECPSCAELEKVRKKKELEAKREQQRLEREQQKEVNFWKSPFEQRTFSFCAECGTLLYNGKKFCSEKCCKAQNNRRGKDKRLRKIKGLTNIDLKELYARDEGICWICGDRCDFEDYVRDEKGSFIAGARYPSIDHIYPISKGGQHTWDNVRLAHCRCNTLKGAKVVSA